MAACNMQTAVLQNDLLPVVIQAFLGEICSKALLTLVQSAIVVKAINDLSQGCCVTSTIICMKDCLHHGELRCSDLNSLPVRSCTTDSISSDIDEENASEKCAVSILDPIPAPEAAGRVSRHYFSEWLLVTKNKDEEDEDEDEDDDDDDDEEGDEDDDGDDEEGDDDEAGDAEGKEGEGDDDDEEDEADEDDEKDEDEDDDDDDDDDDDESPPKKLRK